jgi:hypothetical protein
MFFRNPSKGEIAEDIIDTLTYDKEGPGFGKAVYICGADEMLGSWQVAYRLHYDEKTDKWTFGLSASIKEMEFKFLIGEYKAGPKIGVSSQSFRMWLRWDDPENRTLPDFKNTKSNSP